MVEGKNGRTLLPSPQSSIPFSFLLLIYLFISFLQIPLSLSLPLFFPFLLSFSSLLRICLSFSFYFCILFSLSSPCPLSPSHVQLALFPGSHHKHCKQQKAGWGLGTRPTECCKKSDSQISMESGNYIGHVRIEISFLYSVLLARQLGMTSTMTSSHLMVARSQR